MTRRSYRFNHDVIVNQALSIHETGFKRWNQTNCFVNFVLKVTSELLLPI